MAETDKDHEKIQRWLFGLAEATVTANGSRRTFRSDMFFEAAESIKMLLEERHKHNAKLREYMDICQNLSDDLQKTRVAIAIKGVPHG